jgi:hypothetical protein
MVYARHSGYGDNPPAKFHYAMLLEAVEQIGSGVSASMCRGIIL